MRCSRTIGLLMALVLAAGAVIVFAPAGTAQDDDDDIPVDFTPTRIGSVDLYFWMEDYDQNNPECQPDTDEGHGESGSYTPFCSARLDVPSSEDSPSRQTYSVNPFSLTGDASEEEIAQFVLDTEPQMAQAPTPTSTPSHHVEEAIRGQGAEFPFTIRGTNAIVYHFHYNANQACNNLVGTPLEFTMQLRRAQTPDGPNQGPEEGDVISRSVATAESCGHSGTMSQTGSQDVTVGVDVDQPIQVDAGETLIVEIFAEADTQNLEWLLLFEDSTYDTKVELRTPNVVEKAIWATGPSGTPQSIFDPNAPEDERFMIGHLGLRSPFGALALPDTGDDDTWIRGSVENPEGSLINLHPDHAEESLFSVLYEPIDGWNSNNDALQVYRFSQIDGENTWNYDPDQEAFMQGPHTITASGDLVGDQARSMDAGTTVAMGDFGFTLETVPGEESLHHMVPGQSTTFLLQLTNEAPTTETFELDTEFRFSEGGGAWSVNLVGADANDRVTLNEGERALVRVTVTPPSQATIGDSARVALDARSLTADSIETQTLEATITDRTTRDVDVLIVREDPYNVGVDRTTQIDVFLWNQGTASDELRASFIEDSFDPDDTDIFDASFPQRTFPNVAPGDVTRLPIDVTTTNLVDAGQTLSFGVEGASTENPDATGQETVTALVDAVRDLSVTTLVGTNDKATISERFGKFNISGGGGIMSDDCEAPSGWNPSPQFQRNCFDFTNHTYHVFHVENRGDLAEEVNVEEVGGSFDDEPASDNDCDAILPDRFEDTAFVSRVDLSDPGNEEPIDEMLTVQPGETVRFFLRVSYDAESNYWPDIGSDGPCDWESYTNNVRVNIPGTDESNLIKTVTRVYSLHPGEDHGDNIDQMPSQARANLALQDVTEHEGTLVSLPDFLPVNPENVTEEDPAVLPFSLSLQSGHYDPAQLTVIGSDAWDVEIVPRDAQALELDDGGILYPARFAYDAPIDEEPRYAPEAFHDVSGAHLEAELHIKSIPEGLQEGHRQTFTILAESSQDSSVRDTLEVGLQLGEEFAFNVDPGVEELEAEQGGEVAFALEIFNTGVSRDTYTVEATASPGVYDDPLVQQESVSISAGTSKTVSLHLEIPSGADAPANIDVDITADAGSATEEPFPTQSVTYAVDVVPQGSLSLQGPDEPARIGPSGEASLGFTIVNDGSTDQEVELTELVAPLGFETTLTDGNANVTVDAGSSEAFTYLIEAPENVLEGSTFPFTLQATDEEGNIATGVGHASVIGETAVRLVAEEDEAVVERGSNTTFPVRVENPGNTPAEYDLEASFATSEWTMTVRDADNDPIPGDRVQVPERSFERVFVDVRAPDEVPEGHVESIVLTAATVGDREVSHSVVLDAAIHDHAVRIIVEGAESKDAFPGENVEYRLTLVNEGNGEDQIRLSFEGDQAPNPPWEASTRLDDDTTPLLEPGERLEDVIVHVHVPGPSERPVPVDGETTVIRATSTGETPQGASPTDTVQVETNLVRYQPEDINDDGNQEMAVDLNRDVSDGYEVFVDPNPSLVERGEISDDIDPVEGLHAIDGDGDSRIEHVVDTTGDGIGDAYFDPDRANKNTITFTADMTGDGQPDYPLDTTFNGRIDSVYAPGPDDVFAAANEDFTGDGHRELITDTTGDTFYDTFVDPRESPPLVTDINRDGDVYKLDTNGDGNVDTHYDATTQQSSDARAANLGDFFATYWWFLLVFLAVIAMFGLIVYRRV